MPIIHQLDCRLFIENSILEISQVTEAPETSFLDVTEVVKHT
jgi:hypothetical protein